MAMHALFTGAQTNLATQRPTKRHAPFLPFHASTLQGAGVACTRNPRNCHSKAPAHSLCILYHPLTCWCSLVAIHAFQGQLQQTQPTINLICCTINIHAFPGLHLLQAQARQTTILLMGIAAKAAAVSVDSAGSCWHP